MSLRVIFMGTPAFSVPTLRAVAEAGHEVIAVYSQSPRAASRRGLKMTPSPVHREAESLGIEVRTPLSLKGEAEQAAYLDLQADIAVVVAYGLLLPKAIIAGTRLGCYSGHASLLPRWRGAAPIQRAIMTGDTETGMMVIRMEEGLDTGPVALLEKVAIESEMTAGELHDLLMQAGASLMVETLAELEAGRLKTVSQSSDGITYAKKIDQTETRIDWTLSATAVDRRIRGISPFPGAWCEVEIDGKTERLKLLRSGLTAGQGEPGTILDDRLEIACGEGAVRLVEVQRAGGKPVTADEFLRGAKIVKRMKLL